MSRSFIKNGQVAYAGAAVSAASNTDDDSSIFDMQGFKNAVFVTTITDSASTGVATMLASTNTTSSTSGATAVTGASSAVTCAVNDDVNGTLLVVEVENVLERYIFVTRTSATANIAFGEVLVYLHNGVSRSSAVPLAAHSTVSTATAKVDA